MNEGQYPKYIGEYLTARFGWDGELPAHMRALEPLIYMEANNARRMRASIKAKIRQAREELEYLELSLQEKEPLANGRTLAAPYTPIGTGHIEDPMPMTKHLEETEQRIDDMLRMIMGK